MFTLKNTLVVLSGIVAVAGITWGTSAALNSDWANDLEPEATPADDAGNAE